MIGILYKPKCRHPDLRRKFGVPEKIFIGGYFHLVNQRFRIRECMVGLGDFMLFYLLVGIV